MAIPSLFNADSGYDGMRHDPVAHHVLRTFKTGTAIAYGLTSGVASKTVTNTEYAYAETGDMIKRVKVLGMADNTGTGISFTLEDTTMLHANIILAVSTTGEQLFITGVTGTQITVQRGFAGSAVQPIILSSTIPLYFYILTTAFEEGSLAPNNYIMAPNNVTNCVQIFRSAYSLTGTALAVKDYNGGHPDMLYQQATVERIANHIEQALLFSNLSYNVIDGRPMRTTRGLFAHIKTNRLTIPPTGITTAALNAITEAMYRHSVQGYGNERIVLASPSVVLAMNALIEKRVIVCHHVNDKRYGFNYLEWVTPMGTFKVINHPVFRDHPMFHGTMLSYHPALFRKRVLRAVAPHNDIMFGTRDTKTSGLIAELGAEYAGEKTAMAIDGFYNADLR